MKLKTGPANWEANDLKTDTSWVYEITDKQKQQLTDTIKRNYEASRPLFDYTAAEFDLSGVWATLEKAFCDAHFGWGLSLVCCLGRETLIVG